MCDPEAVFLIQAGDRLNIVASNALNESFYAAPAIVDNTQQLRSDKHLWAVGK